MTILTVRDFRKNLAASLEKVDAGEHLFVRRRNRLYAVVAVRADDLGIEDICVK